MACLPLKVLGSGRALPAQRVSSLQLDQRWQLPPGTTEANLGVSARHVGTADDSTIALATEAAHAALADAGLTPNALDGILATASAPWQAIPCNAALVQRALGLGASGLPAFDVNATCLGFLVALETAAAQIALGRQQCVLIVASEMPSRGMNPNDPNTAGLFGDGAAAVVVGRTPPGESSAWLAGRLATYGEDAELCQLRAGGSRHPYAQRPDDPAPGYFEMDGPTLYRRAARHLRPFFSRLLAEAELPADALDCIVPHQASGHALEHAIRRLQLPPERVVRILDDYGNQVAASIPHALHVAREQGRLQRGQHLALVGTGAGLALGGAVLRY